MGCDIHANIAVVRLFDGEFDGGCVIPLANEPRNYDMFGFMAGVRGDGPAVAEPRGLPVWWQALTEYRDFDVGDHSESWLTLEELFDAIERTEADSAQYPGGPYPQHYWRGVHAMMLGVKRDRDDEGVYLVFGFDN